MSSPARPLPSHPPSPADPPPRARSYSQEAIRAKRAKAAGMWGGGGKTSRKDKGKSFIEQQGGGAW